MYQIITILGVASEPWCTTFVFFRIMHAKSENLTHIGESAEKGLELVFTVCNSGSIFSEEKVARRLKSLPSD